MANTFSTSISIAIDSLKKLFQSAPTMHGATVCKKIQKLQKLISENKLSIVLNYFRQPPTVLGPPSIVTFSNSHKF